MAGEAHIMQGYGIRYEFEGGEDQVSDVSSILDDLLRIEEYYDHNSGNVEHVVAVRRLTRSGDPQDGNFDHGFQKVLTYEDLTTDEAAALSMFATNFNAKEAAEYFVIISADG